MEAQKFMNLHRIDKCYECDGVFFKHEANANGRAKTSGKEVIPHTVSAGVVKQETKSEEE